MNDLTPIQKLQRAIEEYAEHQDNGEHGTMSGWVLGYQMTYFNTDQDELDIFPVMFDSTYTLGPTTSQDLAIGLARRAQRLIERSLDEIDREEDDDGD